MATSIANSMIDDIEFKQTRATSSLETRSSSNSALGLVTSHQTSRLTFRCKPMLHPKRWSSPRARSPHQSSQLDENRRNEPKRDPKGTWISACHEPGHRPCSRRLAHGTGRALARVHYRLAGQRPGSRTGSSSPSWTTAGLIAKVESIGSRNVKFRMSPPDVTTLETGGDEVEPTNSTTQRSHSTTDRLL